MEIKRFLDAKSLNSVCRTCLCDLREGIAFGVNDLLVQKHKDITVNTDILMIKEVLLQCTSIQINAEDNLPKNLCQQCVTDLSYAYEFIKKCRNSQLTLQSATSLKCSDNENVSVLEQVDTINDDSEDGLEDFSLQLEEDDIKPPPDIKPIIQTTTEKTISDKLNQKKETRYAKVRKHECPECLKKFYAPSVLAEHMGTHTKERPYICSVCSARFRFKRNLKRHGLVHSGVKAFTCEMCSKEFAKKASLQVHMRTHTGETPYECQYCNRRFKQSGCLTVHLRTRHKNDPTTQPQTHECPICKRRLSSKTALQLHEQRVHTAQGFLCSLCGNRYASNKSLQIHLLVHTNEKPFVCDYCGRTFRQQTSLQLHLYTHTGEKPYSCNSCDKKFSQSAHMKRHIRMQHTNERPYVCRYCEKAFGVKSVLKVHERIHTGEKPYVCHICGKGFYDSGNRKKHMLRHEKNDVEVIVINDNNDSL